jgi:tripartite ATP-independent transporter DctP family solute receptor
MTGRSRSTPFAIHPGGTMFKTFNRDCCRASAALAAVLVAAICSASLATAQVTLRYGHPNPKESIPGQQADDFARLVGEKTKGAVKIVVYPSSQLGKLQESVEAVKAGSMAINHNTMAAIGSLYEPLGALDTPYLYRDVDHLLKVTNVDSPFMKKLNEDMIKQTGVRVLYTFYFGTRQLTANKQVKSPADLKGLKIRAIPFPIYMAAVEGMGATATPIDWSETPTALATGIVSGQENPVDTIWNAKFQTVQSNLMLTSHIMGAEAVVINEKVWQGFSPEIQAQIRAAAAEAGAKATKSTIDLETETIAKLRGAGMKVTGPSDGLDIAAFRTSVTKVIDERFGAKYGDIYKQIRAM